MKSKIISAFIAIILGTIGLCSTISHANDQKSFIKTVTYNTSGLAVHQVNKLVEQSSNQITSLKVNTYEKFINKPLLSISTVAAAGNYIPEQDFSKKNEIFELATIFNDKLQQIISKFSDNKQHKYKNMDSDLPEDKNAINCDVKKH